MIVSLKREPNHRRFLQKAATKKVLRWQKAARTSATWAWITVISLGWFLNDGLSNLRKIQDLASDLQSSYWNDEALSGTWINESKSYPDIIQEGIASAQLLKVQAYHGQVSGYIGNTLTREQGNAPQRFLGHSTRTGFVAKVFTKDENGNKIYLYELVAELEESDEDSMDSEITISSMASSTGPLMARPMKLVKHLLQSSDS